jgi:multidrug efflux system membrane fusion protein
MKPLQQEITSYLYYNGTTRGVQETEIRPKVAGYLDQVLLVPDRQVKQGDLLFIIDQRTYKIAVDRARAELNGKKATVQSAKANLDRVRQLNSQGAASDQELIDRQAAYDLAVAQMEIAQAELDQALKNLEDTEIRAEISGRVSRNFVDKGTLVQVNSPVLATIVNDDRIFADFQVSETEFLDYIRKNPMSRTQDADKMPPIVVELGMADEEGYPHVGRVVSGDNKVDPSTATYGVRAIFDNPDKQIASGLYVRIRAVMGTVAAILVPDVALQADQLGPFVYVVEKNKDGQDVAMRRSVEIGPQIGPYRRIKSGLKPDDLVIFNGLINVRPESPVQPVFDPPPAVPSTQPATVPSTQTSSKSRP